MLAKVVSGRGIGRTLGFPTANLEFLTPDEMPASGVYAVDVQTGAETFRGVLNVGIRPTFGASERVAEVHILDFDQDIYNTTLELKNLQFLREERFFDTPEALIEQIRKDQAMARTMASPPA